MVHVGVNPSASSPEPELNLERYLRRVGCEYANAIVICNVCIRNTSGIMILAQTLF